MLGGCGFSTKGRKEHQLWFWSDQRERERHSLSGKEEHMVNKRGKVTGKLERETSVVVSPHRPCSTDRAHLTPELPSLSAPCAFALLILTPGASGSSFKAGLSHNVFLRIPCQKNTLPFLGPHSMSGPRLRGLLCPVLFTVDCYMPGLPT